jgi:hypothetical protein
VKTWTCLSALILIATFAGHASADAPQSSLKAPPLQEWQLRREKLDHAIIGFRQNDPDARKELDQILNEWKSIP